MISKEVKIGLYHLENKIYNMNGEKKWNVIRITKQLDNTTIVPTSQIYSCENLPLSCFEPRFINGYVTVTIT